MVKLSSICTLFTDGDWIESKDQSDCGIRLIQTGNIGEGCFLEKEGKEKYISEETFVKLKCEEVFSGDILISRLPEPVGRACIIPLKSERMITAVDCSICRVNEKLIDKEYLCYFLQSRSYYQQLKNNVAGTTRKRISRKNLGDVEIDIPSFKVQKHVVDALNKMTTIIQGRKQELQELDNFIKSRFVEMFGGPFDTGKWIVKELKDVAESMVDGSNVNPDYYEFEGEVLFLRIQNVWRNEFRLEDSVYISQEINHNQYYDTSLKNGDLLITKIGRYYTKDSSLGRVSVYRGEDDCANYSNNIMRVRLNNSINSEFVNALLNLDDYQSYIKRTSKGGTDKRALSKSLIGSYPIIIPPKYLQDEFVSFVAQVDKLKFEVQKSLDETQTLMDSLMQQYFG